VAPPSVFAGRQSVILDHLNGTEEKSPENLYD
jgi:hypothetical protein